MSRTDGKMEKAIKDVLQNGMSQRAAAKANEVNLKNLRSRVQGETISALEQKVSILEKMLVTVKGHKPDGILFLYDLHVPQHDVFLLQKAVEFAKASFNIKKVVLGGDFLDCATLSSFVKDKSIKPFSSELAEGRTILGWLLSEFPYSGFVYIVGNHEERIERYLRSHAPEIVDLSNFTLPALLSPHTGGRIEFVDIREESGAGYPVIPGWWAFHGHELGICPVASPAKRYMDKLRCNFVVGHIHKKDSITVSSGFYDMIFRGYSVGTLAKRSPHYRPINDWINGFAVLEVSSDGNSGKTFHNYHFEYGDIVE